MYIMAFFTNSGVPETGLSATIRVRLVSDNSLTVTDEAMTEVGDGWYKYNFTGYNDSVDYAFRCDGSSTLSGTERYVFAGNENYKDDIENAIWNATSSSHVTSGTMGNIMTDLKDEAFGKWTLDPTAETLTLYKSDGTTVLKIFDLTSTSSTVSAFIGRIPQ